MSIRTIQINGYHLTAKGIIRRRCVEGTATVVVGLAVRARVVNGRCGQLPLLCVDVTHHV